MNRKLWKNGLKSFVDIKRDEFIQTFLMFAYNFLVIASYTMVKSIRDALFIHRIGAAKLPYVYIGIAIFAGIFMQGYSRIAQKIRRSQLIIGSNLFFTLNILIFWWLFRYDWAWLSYGFYIWGDIFIAISIAQFWLTANNIFDPRQAKRLFGFILSGGTLGGITAGVASRLMVRFIGTDNMFLVVGFLLLICAMVIKQIPIREALASAKKLASKDIGGVFTLIRKNRHLLLLAAIICVTLVVNTLIDFQFKNILQQNYKSKDALTGFFGTYYAYINILTIFFQILVP